MGRYQVVAPLGVDTSTPWGAVEKMGSFFLQAADIIDTRNDYRYRDGAYRVVKAPEMKPAKRGKGGTVPFYGETAWSHGESLLRDLAFAEQREQG